MYKAKFLIIISSFLVLISPQIIAAGSGASSPEKAVNQIFKSLPGAWDGRAIETPVGPVDYNINFITCSSSMVAGVAELNVSDHHWQFWKSNDELRLTFLSTFRGNLRPTLLVVTRVEGNTLHLHAPMLSLLTLSVTLIEPQIIIRVLHHKKPHVTIRLERTKRLMSEGEAAVARQKSCSALSS